MAEALFKSIIEEVDDLSDWQVESAGTWAIKGRYASDFSQQVMKERGLDLSNHRSQGVEREFLRKFDLILTMEKGHKEALRVEFPEISARVHTLSEMVGSDQDVEDPIGRSLAEYRATADEIEHLLSEGFQKIMTLTAPNSER